MSQIDTFAPLAPVQRWWYRRQAAGSGPDFNIPVAVRLRGPLDPARLEAALRRLAAQHESLRMGIEASGAQPILRIEHSARISLHRQTAPEPGADGVLDRTVAWGITDWALTPFDLANGPLWRAGLFRLGTEDHVLSLGFNHLIMDAWSVSLFMAQLGEIYADPERLIAPVPQYSEYSLGMQALPEPPPDWWLENLRGMPPLGWTNGRLIAGPCRSANSVERAFAPESAAEWRLASRRAGVSENAYQLAAFGLMLREMSKQNQFVVACAVSVRNDPYWAGTIGVFVTPLPIAVRIDPDSRLNEFADSVANSVCVAIENNDCSYASILDALDLPAIPGRQSLAQVGFQFTHVGGRASGWPSNLQVSSVVPEPRFLKFDMSMFMGYRSTDLAAVVVGRSDVYDATTLERVLRLHARSADALSRQPDCRVSALRLGD